MVERARQLDRSAWKSASHAAISDFWWEQSLVYAQCAPVETEADELRRLYALLDPEVVPPKLRILLAAPAGTPAEVGPSSTAPARPTWSPVPHSDLQHALAVRVRRPGEGPWLQLDCRDLDWAVEEVAAAVQAMR
jgi:hypothetical protein